LFGQRITVALPPPLLRLMRLILRFAVSFSAGELESVALIVNEDVPAVVGVPLIWPELLSVSPAGREPELIDQL
jgi:hypothetical protein